MSAQPKGKKTKKVAVFERLSNPQSYATSQGNQKPVNLSSGIKTKRKKLETEQHNISRDASSLDLPSNDNQRVIQNLESVLQEISEADEQFKISGGQFAQQSFDDKDDFLREVANRAPNNEQGDDDLLRNSRALSFMEDACLRQNLSVVDPGIVQSPQKDPVALTKVLSLNSASRQLAKQDSCLNDSINMRESNGSMLDLLQSNKLFQRNPSIQGSDKKSAYFCNVDSPNSKVQNSRPSMENQESLKMSSGSGIFKKKGSTGGSSKRGKKVNNFQEDSILRRASPAKKNRISKLKQKEIQHSQHTFKGGRNSTHDFVLSDSDKADHRPGGVVETPPNQIKKFDFYNQKYSEFNSSNRFLKDDSLNNSRIETEGQIGPTPNQKQPNLFATGADTDVQSIPQDFSKTMKLETRLDMLEYQKMKKQPNLQFQDEVLQSINRAVTPTSIPDSIMQAKRDGRVGRIGIQDKLSGKQPLVDRLVNSSLGIQIKKSSSQTKRKKKISQSFTKDASSYATVTNNMSFGKQKTLQMQANQSFKSRVSITDKKFSRAETDIMPKGPTTTKNEVVKKFSLGNSALKFPHDLTANKSPKIRIKKGSIQYHNQSKDLSQNKQEPSIQKVKGSVVNSSSLQRMAQKKVSPQDTTLSTKQKILQQFTQDDSIKKYFEKKKTSEFKKTAPNLEEKHKALFRKQYTVEEQKQIMMRDEILRETPLHDKISDSTSFQDQIGSKRSFYANSAIDNTSRKSEDRITSFTKLFEVLGIQFNPINSIFTSNGRDYKLDIDEILREYQRARTHRSYLSKSSHSQILQQISKPNIQTSDLKTPRTMGMDSFALGGIGAIGCQVSNQQISQRLKDQNSTSQNNLNLPLRANLPKIKDQATDQQISKKLDLPPVGFGSSSAQGNGSHRSMMSGANSVQSKARKKSSLVASHEQNAYRMRNRMRNGSRDSIRAMSGRGSSRASARHSAKGLGSLQMERQNLTDNANVPPPLSNPQYMMQMSKLNLSQNQLTGKVGPDLIGGQPPNIPLPYSRENSGSGTVGSQITPVHKRKISGAFPPRRPTDLALQESQLTTSEINQRCWFQDSEDKNKSQMAYDDYSNNQAIHLAFLFASPLMLKTSDNKYYDVLPLISFQEEFEQIKEYIEEKNISFNYRYSVATSKNLQTALRENPVGLHFSGHGFKNTESLYQGDKKRLMKYKNKGDVLIFENENGASDIFFTTDLQKMVKEVRSQLLKLRTLNNPHSRDISPVESTMKHKSLTEKKEGEQEDKLETEVLPTELQFVYVASCHSEQVGMIFLEAGIPHVICIDQNQTILDKAAIEFSKFFYDEVFDEYRSICDAYAYAKEKVERTYGKFQADKIKLLIQPSHGDQCPLKKDYRLKPVEGELFRVGVDQKYLNLPHKVSPFVSRNQDMFEVLKLLAENSIIQIYGMPGLGKSCLLKNVTCFLGERDIYKDGVLYIDFYQVSTLEDALQIINAYLKDEEDFYQSFNQNELQQEVDRLKTKLSVFRKMLLSIDNIDHLNQDNYEKFLSFLMEVASPELKIVFTSSKFNPELFNEGFAVKKIMKLKKHDSVDLFMKKIPLSEGDKQQFLDYQNIIDLHKVTEEKYGQGSEFIPALCKMRHAHTQNCMIKYLQGHPIFEFLAGIPLVISIVAPFAVYKSLAEIFLYLAEKRGNNFQAYLDRKLDDDSLIHCLEYCTQHFKNSNKNGILELWVIIGVQGPGILYDDLKAIYTPQEQDEDTSPQESLSAEQKLDTNLEELINFSLIESEGLDKAGKIKRYRVSPFVDQYISQKIHVEERKESLRISCPPLLAKIVRFKEEYASDVKQCQTMEDLEKAQASLDEKIKHYESQILHVVQQMFTIDDVVMEEEDEGCQEKDENEASTSADLSKVMPVNDSGEVSSKHATSGHKSVKSSQKSSTKIKKKKQVQMHDGPKVSDQVKFGRSTFNLEKKSNKKVDFQSLMIDHSLGEQGIDEGIEFLEEGMFPQRQRHDTQFDHHGKKKFRNPRDIVGYNSQQVSKQNSQITESEEAESKEGYSQIMQPQEIDGALGDQSKDEAYLFSEDDPMAKTQANLMFDRKKDALSFRKNRDFATSHKDIDPVDLSKNNDSLEPGTDETMIESTFKKKQILEISEDQIPERESMDSDSSSEIERNMSPFEIAKVVNPMMNDSEQHYAQLMYEDKKDTEEPSAVEMKLNKRRMTRLLKNVPIINFNDSGNFQKLKESIADKSKKTDLFSSVRNNPDIMQSQNVRRSSLQKPLSTIDEGVNKSAPLKNQPIDSVQAKPTSQKDIEQEIKQKLLGLNPHEELLFHFLSILSLIPSKRPRVNYILDIFNQRKIGQGPNTPTPEKSKFNLIQEAEKRLKKFETFIEIPDEAKLLRANTMMIELYIQIKDQSQLLVAQQSKSLKVDSIYESADGMRPFFEEIQFIRGLAILDYIQAKRLLRKWNKRQDYKKLLKESAEKFQATHEVAGIMQCIQEAKRSLMVKDQNDTVLTEDQIFVQDLQKLLAILEKTEDKQEKEFIKFRQKQKIEGLEVKIQPQGQTSDQIVNMLLNPQAQLIIQYVKLKKG